MKLLRVLVIAILSTFILAAKPAFASPDFAVKEWKEYANITPTGKTTNLYITGTPQNLVFGYSFGYYPIRIPSLVVNASQLQVLDVKINGKPADYLMDENRVLLRFPRINWHEDGDKLLEVFISYEEKILETKDMPFVRFTIPRLASGAKFIIAYDYGESLDILGDSDDSFLQNGVFLKKGIVPEDGYQENIFFKKKITEWIIKVRYVISLDGHNGDLKLSIPSTFENMEAKILSDSIFSNPEVQTVKTENGFKIFNYKILPHMKKIVAGRDVKILTDNNFQNTPPSDEASANYILPQDKQLLLPILLSIRNNPEYEGLPLHVKIAKFVNNYITYDLSYTGKNLKVEEIIRGKTGVCIEYATLYNALARLAGIPTVISYGYVFKNFDQQSYGKPEYHAWNKSKIAGKWIFIDPTWGLNKGVIPSSNVPANFFVRPSFSFSGAGDASKIAVNFDVDMRPVLLTSSGSRSEHKN